MVRRKSDRDVKIGRRLRFRRQLAGLSMEELGAKVGLADRYISNIEVGWRSFPVPRSAQFAAALGMTTDQLVEHLGLDPDHVDQAASA